MGNGELTERRSLPLPLLADYVCMAVNHAKLNSLKYLKKIPIIIFCIYICNDTFNFFRFSGESDHGLDFECKTFRSKMREKAAAVARNRDNLHWKVIKKIILTT